MNEIIDILAKNEAALPVGQYQIALSSDSFRFVGHISQTSLATAEDSSHTFFGLYPPVRVTEDACDTAAPAEGGGYVSCNCSSTTLQLLLPGRRSLPPSASHVKPSQAKSSQVKSSQVKPSQAKPSQVKSSQIESSLVNPSQV